MAVQETAVPAPVKGDTFALARANYTYGPVTAYFVLGDNRRNSYDSHAWGNTCSAGRQCDFVPTDLILGALPATAKPLSRWWCQ